MQASASVSIARPIGDVWAFITDVENMAEWVRGVSDPRRTSGGQFAVGSTFTSKYTFGGKAHDVDYEVVEFVPPQLEVVRSTSGPFPLALRFELEAAGGGTRLTNTLDAGSDSTATSAVFGLGGPLIRRRMARELEAQLEAVKAKLEGLSP